MSMKLPNMLPFRFCLLFAAALWSLPAQADLAQAFCSSENSAADTDSVTNLYQSLGACQDQCKDDYAFGIVQWQQCWCSNYFPASQASLSDCSQSCPGYPKEQCGNLNTGFFGYIRLSVDPSGTAGVSSSTSTTPSETPSPPPPSSSDQEAATSYTLSPSSTSSSSSTSTSSPSTTRSTLPIIPATSVLIETVAGAIVTQTVTSTPAAVIGSRPPTGDSASEEKGVSPGAVAGIVIGVLAGVVIVAGAAFLLWRRRRTPTDSEKTAAGTTNRSPTRNVSVLSKAGLLNRNGPTMGERENDDNYYHNHTGSTSVRHSMLYGGAEGVAPTSPLDSSNHSNPSSRGGNKPMVYDQRLNPSALFANHEANGSRISMQDQQDYSRPLGIANPDPRASFESRKSHN